MSRKIKNPIRPAVVNKRNALPIAEEGKEEYYIPRSIFHAVMNSTRLFCLSTDPSGIIRFINSAAQLKLGFKSASLVNKVSFARFIDPVMFADPFSNPENSAIDQERVLFEKVVSLASSDGAEQQTISCICKNNTRFKLDADITASFDVHGKIIAYQIIGTENIEEQNNRLIREEVEKNLISFIENAPSGVFVADASGNYVVVNSAATSISGYSREELLHMNRMQMIHPADQPLAKEKFNELFAVGHCTFEARFQTKSGESRHWRVNSIKVLDERYMGIVSDVSDHVKAQETLKKTNQFLETIVENIPNMLFLKDAQNLSFVQFNRAGEELTGYSREEFLGKTDFDFFPREQAEFFRQKDREVLEGKNSIFIEEELIQTRHQGERILHTKKVPIFNAEGEAEYLLGFSEDITERKKAEREFMEQKLELDNLFTLSTNLLCIADLDFSFRKLNAEWEKMLGYQVAELHQYNFLDLVHPEDLEETKRAMTSLTVQQPIRNYRNRYRRKDGTYIWIEWQVISTETLIYTIGQDINAKMFYEEELRKSKEAAEAANKAKSDFLANMSHEIRNPLNAIIGFAELLHNAIKDEKLLSQVDSIRNSGKSLLGILNDILDLSKIEAGKMKLEMKPVNLNFLLKDIENMFSHRIHEKGLAFSVEKDPDPTLKLVLDEVRLHQILFNLIGNALKFTESGFIRLTIHKVLKSQETIDLTISVQDSGIGIPKEQHQLIFETFQQQEGQSTKKFGGTGLGLSISKKLAEMMGGHITLVSEPGMGSTFKVTLPDVRIQHKEVFEHKDFEFDPSTVMFDHAKVLIVEDSEINLNLIVMTLESTNLILFTATNGKEAVEMALKHHPDIILMDLRMPLVNGYEAAQTIKADETLRNIPIIAISASTDLKNKEELIGSLFSGYLIKPFILNDLIDLLKKYLPCHPVETRQPAEPKEMEYIEISDEQKAHLNDIIDILEREFLPINEIVIKKQLIEQIEFFGKGLRSFGEANSVSIIADYGKKICNHVDNFEIDKMMKTLKQFPEIIEKIKAISRGTITS